MNFPRSEQVRELFLERSAFADQGAKRAQTVTSMSSSVIGPGAGSACFFRLWRYPCMASRILAIASWRVFPCETQPGSAGHSTTKTPTASGSTRTRNFMGLTVGGDQLRSIPARCCRRLSPTGRRKTSTKQGVRRPAVAPRPPDAHWCQCGRVHRIEPSRHQNERLAPRFSLRRTLAEISTAGNRGFA